MKLVSCIMDGDDVRQTLTRGLGKWPGVARSDVELGPVWWIRLMWSTVHRDDGRWSGLGWGGGDVGLGGVEWGWVECN